jgi:phosphatidylserine/phosphatidylglycerophosphate/cardiolipin synthase-like enzyme
LASGLGELSPSDLRALGFALRSGRLAAPFSIAGLQRVLGKHADPMLADWLSLVSKDGCSPASMALWLEAFAETSEGNTPVHHAVQLVTTAPSGDSAVHRDTAVVVQDLFRRAKHSVLISTYGIYGGREIFRELAQRMIDEPKLSVRLFVDLGQKAAPEFLQFFREHHWPEQSRRPEIYAPKRPPASASESSVLHAKCVLIDSEEILLTSANFTDAAHYRNVEAGVVVRSRSVAEQVAQFFNGLIRSGFCVRIS